MSARDLRSSLTKGALLVAALGLVVWGAFLLTEKYRWTETSVAGRSEDADVTFNEHIAQILFENCALCHRPGESGPFSLLSYADAKKRAGLIAAVTGTRYMPPWLPERGEIVFLGERGLSDEQIELIRKWVEQGAQEGDPADRPTPPRFTEGWQLGRPDLIVEMTEPYRLGAEGRDVFRNFVLPVPLSKPRWVKAVELRPGNPRIVHHAVMQVDRSRSSRRRDEEDAQAGFAGMDMAGSEAPGGRSVGWTPGKLPIVDERLAWRLDPGSDIVLQLHMLPSGKPETVDAEVGLYFTDKRPDVQASSLLLRNDMIDIPPGAESHVMEDSVTLPVAVTAIGIYPHAHYLGKRMEAFAILPDGTKQWLLHIPRWDFNWQDDYRYAKPIPLPAGSTVTMRYSYDNSSSNPLNPHDPPRRVRFGNRSTDEMATLAVQVLPPRPEDRALLLEAAMRPRLERNPDNWYAHNVMGASLKNQGRYEEAIRHLKEAIRLVPGHPGPRYNLGNALLAMGRPGDAVHHYRRVIAIDAIHPKVHNNLAVAYQQMGELEQAIDQFREQLTLSPDDARAHANLGQALLAAGQPGDAERAFRRALELDPESVQALEGRGDLARSRGALEDAEAFYRSALQADPEAPGAHYGLGSVLLSQREHERAKEHFRRAVAGDSAYVGLLNDDAWRLATDPDPSVREPEQALLLAKLADEQTDHRIPELLDTLAAAQAANGQFARAVDTLEEAMVLAETGSASVYIDEFRERLARYRRGEIYVETTNK